MFVGMFVKSPFSYGFPRVFLAFSYGFSQGFPISSTEAPHCMYQWLTDPLTEEHILQDVQAEAAEAVGLRWKSLEMVENCRF